jgi:predicted RNA-binding Zn-ribbon protein involved in translation (DUF1610 family)
MESQSPTYTCPKCGWQQYPLLHTADSRCGGIMVWEGRDLVCVNYGKRNGYFNCDECGHVSHSNDCLS